jgi:Flp pilus assembly protein TadD
VAPEPSVWRECTKAIFKSAFARLRSFLAAVYGKLSWENLKFAVNASASNAIKFVWIALGILIVSFVVRDLSSDIVMIEPISVPKAFAENGYTPEVASRRLRDALNDYAAKAETSMQGPSIAPRDELPNFVVPKIDLSLDTVVGSIRSVLHYGSRRSISGELTVRSKLAWLRLRVDGKEVHSSPNGIDLENPDELFVSAIPAIMENIRPYLVASSLYKSDPAGAARKADEIIARLPASDINVQWAYVLKGSFLIDQKNYVQAEKILRTAVRLNDTNAMAHNDLGFSLYLQGRHDEAETEYRRAIELDPKASLQHANLGLVFRARGQRKEAISELRRAMELDPKSSRPHNDLGIILRDQGEPKEAVVEFSRALELDPKDANSHNNLGIALSDQGLHDEAIAEYRRAIELDPKASLQHNNLGVSLNAQGKTDEAIAEYHRAIELDPNNLMAKNNLETILQASSSAK